MEGAPPLPSRPGSQPNSSASSAIVPSGLAPSTYVVQAPKDQIFRVPPPENAQLVEQYRDMVKNKKKTPACYVCLAKGLAVALLIVIICLVVVLIFYLVVRPADPGFSVASIVTVGKSSGKHKFDIMLRATNPSGKMGYYFEKGGSASLSSHRKKVATGEPPAFHVLNQKSEDVELLLRESEKAALPKEIEKSLKGSKDVLDLSLSVDFPVRSSVAGIKLLLKQMNAECDIRVRNLAKETHIVSQKCHAEFQ